jgi:hypothetical protein
LASCLRSNQHACARAAVQRAGQKGQQYTCTGHADLLEQIFEPGVVNVVWPPLWKHGGEKLLSKLHGCWLAAGHDGSEVRCANHVKKYVGQGAYDGLDQISCLSMDSTILSPLRQSRVPPPARLIAGCEVTEGGAAAGALQAEAPCSPQVFTHSWKHTAECKLKITRCDCVPHVPAAEATLEIGSRLLCGSTAPPVSTPAIQSWQCRQITWPLRAYCKLSCQVGRQGQSDLSLSGSTKRCCPFLGNLVK